MGEKPLFTSKAYRAGLIEWSKFKIKKHQSEERSLDPQNFPWRYFDTALANDKNSFEAWFAGVLPEGETSLQEYVEKILAPKPFKRGLEIGGIGTRLFKGFTPGFFDASAGVSLTNFLTNSPHRQSMQELDRDDGYNHTIIEGNIFDDKDPNIHPSTKDKVIEWAQGEKVDFIMERLYAGRDLLPEEPFALSKEVGFWYRQLAEGGLFFAEIPRAFDKHIKEWETYINQSYAGSLDVKVTRLKLDGEESRYVMRLHKLANAPEELPLLDAQSVMKREREMYPHIISTIRS
jgi:hypothetical protein